MISGAERGALWMNALWMNRGHREHVRALRSMCAFIGFIAFVFVFSAIPVSAHSNIQAESTHQFALQIYGNANEDDTIDMRDVTYIKLVIFGKKSSTKFCDANYDCLLYTSPSPRDRTRSRMPSSA